MCSTNGLFLAEEETVAAICMNFRFGTQRRLPARAESVP